MKSACGLVLTGGGARGAYQAGVLAAAFEIHKTAAWANPYPIITGSSAGAINSCLLAHMIAEGFDPAIEFERIWKSISSDSIYVTNSFSLASNGLNWTRALTLGGIGKPTNKILSFLDNSPLRRFLNQHIDFVKIKEAQQRGLIKALAVSMVNYTTGISRTSYMGDASIVNWKREKREGVRTELSIDHIMASSAIPMLFPPVAIDGCYYGDGSLRDYTPLSPGIKFGATKQLVIGVHKRHEEIKEYCKFPTPARILSVILNGILLDAVDLDFERLQRINHTLKRIPGGKTEHLRQVEIFMVTPSQFLSEIAQEEAGKLVRLLKYFLRGLGSIQDSADILSYILFEPSYISRLFELGKKDMLSRSKEYLAFLSRQPRV